MFKVGDVVRVISIHNGGEDKVGTIQTIVEVDECDLEMPYRLKSGWWYGDEELDIVTKYPVKEVTEKTIVPGIYGRFYIEEEDSKSIAISLVDRLKNKSGGDHILNIDEIRHAANLFNILADYLEEKNSA